MGEDDVSGQAPEIGLRAPVQHGLHLVGGTGQHQHMDAAAFKGAAGGGAHRVVEHRAALRQKGLLGIVFRHGHMEGRLIKGTDLLQNVRMEHQGLSEGGADGLLGEIVIGGPQPAGGDEDVCPGPGQVQGLAQPAGVVAYHRVPVDINAQAGQGLGEDLGVGVGNAAQQQLRAHGKDLGGV